MSINKEPIFKTIFGDDWESLPEVFKKHYANYPYSDDAYQVEGHLDVMCRGLYRLLSPVFWLLKGIPPKNDKQAKVTVTFKSDPHSKAFHYNRDFAFSDGKTYQFRSRMLQIEGNQVIELMPFRLGWRLQYFWENNKVILRHNCYVLYIFGKIVPLPLTWLLGAGYAEEKAINDHEFEMFTHITHPIWGKVYGYTGRFKFREKE